jgi:hypothetical protein
MTDLPDQPRLYTRRDAVDYIRGKWGIPITVARIAQDAMTANGRTPIMPPAHARFGNRYLYTAEQLELYAGRLLQDGPSPTTIATQQRAGETKPAAS